LAEQAAQEARRLGEHMPDKVRKEWTVATATLDAPGRKGGEFWPFGSGEHRPRVVVTTVAFMAAYCRKTWQLPLWAAMKYVVLDEVDLLLQAHKETRKKILQCLRHARHIQVTQIARFTQTVLVASTLPANGYNDAFPVLREFNKGMMFLPAPKLAHRAHPMIAQTWQYIPGENDKETFAEKLRLLVQYLQETVGIEYHDDRRLKEKVMVFCQNAKRAAQVAKALAAKERLAGIGLIVEEGMEDAERRLRLEMFRDGRVQLLVTTSHLERGLNIPDIRHVVQFDFADTAQSHLHRIGRASRGGRRGYALNLYDDSLACGRRVLAEAIREQGGKPLDALFSANMRGFGRKLKSTIRYREWLDVSGLPVPKHLRSGDEDDEYTPLLASADEGAARRRGEEAPSDNEGVDSDGEVASEGSGEDVLERDSAPEFR